MKTLYFNKLEFKKAMSFIRYNPIVTKMQLEEYIKKYPLDYSSYPYYASVLITLGDFNEAEKVLEHVEIVSNMDESFANKETRVQNLKYNIIFF